MHVLCITTTYNRDRCLQRLLRCFLEQVIDSEDKATLFVFNSGEPTSFPEFDLPGNKEIILVNRQLALETGKEYESVGQKYMDAIALAPSADAACSADVDDLFLPHYVSDGIKGMKEAYSLGKLAFKPKRSFFKSTHSIVLQENVFEPSIFVDYNWIKEKGYSDKSVVYHSQWLDPLIAEDKILVSENYKAGFMYDWSGELKVYKMSGRAESKENFADSQKVQNDTGNGVTYPISKEKYEEYLEQINEFHPNFFN